MFNTVLRNVRAFLQFSSELAKFVCLCVSMICHFTWAVLSIWISLSLVNAMSPWRNYPTKWGHQDGSSKLKSGCDTKTGIKYENPMPEKIPVTIEAAPNIPAVEAYSGSTDLKIVIHIRGPSCGGAWWTR